VDKPNGGLATPAMRAFRRPQGEFILPLDADDRIHPEMLAKTVQLLKSQPEISIALYRLRLLRASKSAALDHRVQLPHPLQCLQSIYVLRPLPPRRVGCGRWLQHEYGVPATRLGFLDRLRRPRIRRQTHSRGAVLLPHPKPAAWCRMRTRTSDPFLPESSSITLISTHRKSSRRLGDSSKPRA